MKTKTLIGIIVLAVGVVAILFVVRSGGGEEQERVTVERGTVTKTITVSGQVEPEDFADLAFEGIGEVEWVGVEVGDRVTKGQPLVRLDREGLLAQRLEAQKGVEIAQQDYLLMRRDRDDLKPEERRSVELALDQARANRAQIDASLKKTVLISPINGIVTKQEADEGEAVDEVGAIVRIIDDTRFHIEADVPESDITKFSQDTIGIARFDALSPDETTEVRVRTIDPEATVIQDVIYYTTDFELSSLDDRLRSGMSADVDIEVARAENVLVVPRRLLVQEAEGFTALVEVSPGQSEKRMVQIGVEGDDGNVEIVDGLDEGDVLLDIRLQEE